MAAERAAAVTGVGLLIVGAAGLASGLMLAYAAQTGDRPPPGVTGATRGPLVVSGRLAPPAPASAAPVAAAPAAPPIAPAPLLAAAPAPAPPAAVAHAPKTSEGAPAEPEPAAPAGPATPPPARATPAAAAAVAAVSQPIDKTAPAAAAPPAVEPAPAPPAPAASAARDVALGKQYPIVWTSTRVRNGPGARARVVSALLKGARVKILARQGGWLKVSGRKLPDEAWIQESVLFPRDEPAPP